MPSIVPYSLLLAGLVLTASLVVLGADDPAVDPCPLKENCTECVTTKINVTVGNNGTCMWEVTSSGQKCFHTFEPSQDTSVVIFKPEKCDTIHTSTTVAPPTPTSSTAAPPTTPPTPTPSTTTAVPTTTNATTTAAPSTTTNGTSTTPVPSSTTTGGTSTTPAPGNGTTTAPPTPKPAPKSGGFSWASFIGGIVFAAALSSLAYLIWRFYKVRLDRNYHTLSTNLI